MPVLTASIADLRISLIFDHDPFAHLDRIPPAPNDITLIAHRGKPPDFQTREVLFDSGQTWALFKSRGRHVLQNDAIVSDSPPDTFLALEPDFTSGDLYMPDGPEISADDPLPYPLNQVMMIMVLSKGRGLLLHACGIDDNGSGYLFLGNSGDGKSTMAKLWSAGGANVLNDDRIIVREKNGELRMYGTPWNGDFKEHSAGGLPIQKILFLSRGRGNRVQPKRGVEAVSMTLTRCFPPLWDKAGMAFAVNFCHHMTERVPCYELSFVPDARVIHFVRNI